VLAPIRRARLSTTARTSRSARIFRRAGRLAPPWSYSVRRSSNAATSVRSERSWVSSVAKSSKAVVAAGSTQFGIVQR